MNLNELRNLDTNNIGIWPTSLYFFIAIAVFAVIGILGFQFIIQEQLHAIEREKRKEPELKQIFEIKQLQTSNLDAYREQLTNMQERFGTMLQQLPDQNEIPALLKEVSQARQAANLNEVRFEIQPEISKEFYAEKPIALEITGRYHNFGEYVETVASLPRIVTLSEIELKAANSKEAEATESQSILSLNAIAKTYRYIESKGEANARP